MDGNRPGGLAFDDEDVARAYAHRPPYPESLFDYLDGLISRHNRALDLGCGSGKVAHRLAGIFDHVDAVDPSAAMLRVANDGRHPNITWIHASAESADLTGPYDLVTAGASIHWMDHAVLFPKLAGVLSPDGHIGVIEGDGAHDVPWQAGWEAFLKRWLARLGREYDPAGYRDWMTAYEDRVEIVDRRRFEGQYSQSIEDFIECQHSRATWSRANLGQLTSEFDTDLRQMLLPHAVDGMIGYTTRSEVVVCGISLTP